VVWSREGVIYRITPRQNDAVNDTWMADSGRMLYKEVRGPGRLASPHAGGDEGSLEVALRAAADLLAAGGVAVVGSGRSSVEEQFLTRKLAAAAKAPAWLVSRVGEGDRILVSADRNPNVRGALVTGLISALPKAALGELGAAIDSGGVRTVVSVGEDLAAAGISAAQLARISIVYLGTQANATSAAARVVIPTLTVFEKNGTFVNQQFRIQRFARAVPAPAGATDDLVVLARLVAAAGGPALGSDVGSLWPAISAEVPALAAMAYGNIPDTGLLLDSAPWAGLPYAEGPGLHFKPAQPAEAPRG
jgi:NADH-quinone oxidoreductase subunit G